MRRLILIFGLMSLTACTNTVPPPVEYGTPLRSRADLPRGPQGNHKRVEQVQVQAGDTVYAIARRNKISPRSLIVANGLKAPYRIHPGDTLQIPYPRLHQVKKGETIYGISRGYGADMTLLARLNGVQPPYAIKVGEELVLPPVGSTPRMAEDLETPPQAIASKPSAKITSSELPPPASAKKKDEVVAVVPPKKVAVVTAPGPTTKPAAKPVAKPVAKPQFKQQPKQQAALKTIPADTSISRYGFSWPLRGKVLSDFGPKGQGLHNDGVNIRAANGAPVHAAADGTVAYAGNELRGYGNLLLIRHTNGWTSAYAHNSKLMVRRGQEVKRGTVIAKAGRTGGVETSQLHFEIRKGKQAVDPIRYLP